MVAAEVLMSLSDNLALSTNIGFEGKVPILGQITEIRYQKASFAANDLGRGRDAVFV